MAASFNEIPRGPTIPAPTIIPRPAHNISRADISNSALKVLYRLRQAGYAGYLVGGGVRDLLLGREPKDFDVATDARPEQVKNVFRNCRLIGRRFRLAHVQFGAEIIEVATFRAQHEGGEGEGEMQEGRIVRDNVYGTFEEDAVRRDFTVNALYYNIADFSVVDFSTGMQDLKAGILRPIGEPEVRMREDPVRMLRAARFAAKLGFRIDPDTEVLIPRLAGLLEHVPPARLYEEVLKLFHGGYGLEGFERLRHYGLFEALFPAAEAWLASEEEHFPRMLIVRALENTDARVAEGKPVSPAFLIAFLLWEVVRRRALERQAGGEPEIIALQLAAEEVLREQSRRVAFPRRFSVVTESIWSLQPRFRDIRGRRPQRLVTHPHFRAAYDFLLVRAAAGEDVSDLAEWWTDFQTGDDEVRQSLASTANESRGRRRRPRRRRPPRAPALAAAE